MSAADPIPLARALISCESVTPEEAGALGVLERALAPLGFACERMKFGEVDNLWARLGSASPHVCFAGHVDVVPPGDLAAWTHPPFAADIAPDPATGEETLWGRGARDMKGAVAAFVAACDDVLSGGATPFPESGGSISLLITCDEEGPGVDGTKKVLEALAARGETIDQCVVGEPTNPDALGEMIKIGRRGSINAQITVTGVQGHAAYPHEAANPVPALLDILAALRARRLDDGADGFQPSNMEITSIDVGNPTVNVIPASAAARLNIRFNTHHSGTALKQWIEETTQAALPPGGRIAARVETHISGEPFFAGEGGFSALVAQCVEAETGRTPALSTTGGTSDARFIANHAQVCEFGLVGRTIHQVDERAPVEEIRTLARIYARVLRRYFETSGAA